MLIAGCKFPVVVAAMLGVFALSCAPVLAQRSHGIDVSAWQGTITQTEWNNLRNVNDQEFVFIRSSRGGTTGYYNQSDSDNSEGQNTLSQRYDDPFFVQNITRATNAGMLAGAYHFSRPDIIASTQNSGGIANSGTDEANHFLEMAGAWMRPGYLLPVFDLEAGDGIRSDAQITQFSIDFSNRIYEEMGVRPIMYINGNYSAYVVQAPIQDYFPVLWVARYTGGTNPDPSIVESIHPKDTFSPFYGPWDDPPAATHPWSFWQYASTGRLSGYRNGSAGIDVNVAQGGTEFLRDHLVPALWVSGSDGNWSTLANWNSGQPPIAPVQGPGQVSRVGSLTLPSVRLPGSLDTVILERSAENVTVTLDSGNHNIRKLVTREALNITGGTLTVNYTPVAESTPYSVLVSSAVSLTGGALSAHTVQIEPTKTFTLGGGVLTFDTINLAPGFSGPGSLSLAGDVILAPRNGVTAQVQRGAGSGATGGVSLGGGTRTVTVGNGASAVDVSIDVPMTGGTLNKSGAGTLRLTGGNTLDGAVVSQGTLLISPSGVNEGVGGDVQVLAGATLAGTGRVGGVVTTNGVVAPSSVGLPLMMPAIEFGDGSELALDIASNVAYDRLLVTGDALSIDAEATVKVTFGPGYTPTFGQTYTAITGAGSVEGLFGEVVTNGPDMVARSVAGGVVLEVLSGLAGDFNNDGAVDGTDYNLWASNLGGPASALLNVGEAETVDAALYTIWRDNEGATLPAIASAVPEPAGVLLGLSGLMALARRRR